MSLASSDHIYPRAPVLEVAVEIRYPVVSDAKVRKATNALRSQYDEITEDQVVEGSLDFSTQQATFRNLSLKTRLASTDQTSALVITNTNTVWNRLAPYEGWQVFFAAVESQLPKLLKSFGGPEITRIGLRFVNRIDYPAQGDVGYHEDYLTYRISAGEMLDPTNGFKWALQKNFPDLGLVAVIQSSSAQAELPGLASIMFDIDIIADVDVPRKSDDIATILCKMRDLKNEIFESGITDKARDLFNEPRA